MPPSTSEATVTADIGVGDVSQTAPAVVQPAKKKKRPRFSMKLNHPIHGKMELNLADVLPFVRSSLPITMAAAEGDKPQWQQIAKVGTFRGHYAGEFQLTPKVFDEIVRNFYEIDLGNVAFDREHASEQDPTQGSIPVTGAPAQGWLKQLENRGQAGLWGLVEWQPEARADILAGRYKFLSPAIRFGARHPETNKPIGARLSSVAMTNKPFLRGMQPLLASDTEGQGMKARCYSSNEFMPKLRACLGVGPLTSAAECSSTLDTLGTYLAAAGGDASATVHGAVLADHLDPLRELVSAQPAHTWEEVFAAVQAMIAAAIAEHEAEYHSGDDESDDDEEEAASMRDGSPQGAIMTEEQKKAAEDKALKDAADAKALADKAAADKAAADATKTVTATDADVTVQLTEAKGKLTELTFALREKTALLSAAETELVTLRADRDARLAAEQVRLAADRELEVDAAIATWGVKKGISEADKPDLLAMLTSTPEPFRRLYPPVAPAERYRLQNFTGSKPADTGTSSAADVEDAGTLTLSDLITRYHREHPKLTRQEAAAAVDKMTKRTGA